MDRKPKKRCPFQLVPVTAFATWERLPKVFPFQAKPLSNTITLSSLPLHSRTSSAPELRLIPSRVVGLRLLKGRTVKSGCQAMHREKPCSAHGTFERGSMHSYLY